ncbi:hypothetical protein AB1Y20_004765 [Prymnesium parvum]|uniref:PI3K/PI4K catalytic domain-containing protein n=1 Tax=Prymnesium parvum TaxID=97485 RepID=A0AB34J081_PRYPA
MRLGLRPSGPPPSRERLERLRALHSIPADRPLPSLEPRAPPPAPPPPPQLAESLSEMEQACHRALHSLAAASHAGAELHAAELVQQLELIQQHIRSLSGAAHGAAVGSSRETRAASGAGLVATIAEDATPLEEQKMSEEHSVSEDEDELFTDEEPSRKEQLDKSQKTINQIDTIQGISIDEPDEMFDEDGEGVISKASRLCSCGVKVQPPHTKRRPNRSMAALLGDPMCEPLTLVYCLFRYRNNRSLAAALCDRISQSEHPETPTYTMHLCYLMLIEPISAVIEAMLLGKCKTSLHWALQVYWFCQGMIETHENTPGPRNYKRFLRLQREVQTGVGQLAEEKAGTISLRVHRSRSFSRQAMMQSLEATNRALTDAIGVRTVFHDVTRFIDRVTQISTSLNQTEPRSERAAVLVAELEKLAKDLPALAHIPTKQIGVFQRVLNVLPMEAKSLTTHARNPYMLFLEVEDRQDHLDDLSDIATVATEVASAEQHTTRARRLKEGIKRGGGKAKGAVGGAIMKGTTAMRGAVGGVREIRENRHQRKELEVARGNDPFSITETSVERTAQIQQTEDDVVASNTSTPWTAGAEEWVLRKQRIQGSSPFAGTAGWNIAAVIIKADDDLRQEAFCMHMIYIIQKIFRREKLEKLANGLKPYSIQPTSSQSGIIETVSDATSIDAIKRQMLKVHNSSSLEFYYRQRFPVDPPEGSSVVSLAQARENAMCSVAAYGLVQYILQLKDRHNGNILIDSSGRMVHIDFAFMLGWAPGGITFEKPQFKLTKDIVDVFGGRGSPHWDEFVELMVAGLQALGKHWAQIVRNVEMIVAARPQFPFIVNGKRKTVLTQLRRRFLLYKSKKQIRKFVIRMIEYAYENFWTNTYAKFQLLTNGIVA